jgi:hypothetical protein
VPRLLRRNLSAGNPCNGSISTRELGNTIALRRGGRDW